MAFSTSARSFTNLPNATFSASNKNGASPTPWGEKNIWAFDSGLATRDTKLDAAKLRDYGTQGSNGHLGDEKKSGSGVLLEGSHPTSSAWGLRPDLNNRSLTGTQLTDSTNPQTRPANTPASHQICLSMIDNMSPTTTRPPTINLTSSDFKARTAHNSFPSHDSKPPPLYTKFNATAPAIDTPRTSMSPTEARKSIWAMSATNSRDPSQPPSRQEMALPDPGHFTGGNTRTHSLSSQRTVTFDGGSNGVDQMLPQFGQMNLGQNGHAAALRKTSEPWIPQQSHRTMQGGPRLDFMPPREKAEAEELDPFGMGNYAPDDFAPKHAQALNPFSNPKHVSSMYDVRPPISFTAGGAAAPPYDYQSELKTQLEWPAYSEDMALPRELGAVSEHKQALLDPRLQQILALRSTYPAAFFNPYAVANGVQNGTSSPYFPVYPMGLPSLENNVSTRETLVSDGIQSLKLYEFKNIGKNSKRWELSDIFDHIAEFAGDQYGSRFIQTKLETANSDEKERVFREIEPNAIPLMTDVFGNYVIQKFFDHGHQDHKKMIANKMRGQVLNLSLQMYGCRVVQKALEHILVEQQVALVGELENHVLKCVKDQNGNHVIQKAIERCAPETIGFIYQAFLGQVQHLSLHPYGCRVIQRCLERPEWFPSKPRILAELHDSMQHGMIADSYGNYVVQHVVQKGSLMDKNHVFRIVIQGLEGYSKHKFASNVVEKCIEYSDDTWRREVVNALTAPDQRRSEGDTTLVSMIKDNFGNYVIQKLLDKLSFQDYQYFTNHLAVAIALAKRHGCGKQIAAIESRMRRFGIPAHQQRQPASFGIAMPAPYGSHYTSVTNTPALLTPDSQSLQASTVPSDNGDAVEGAQNSGRKESEPALDPKMRR